MKPELRTYTAEYWSCGDDSCKRHSSEATALACIEHRERQAKWASSRPAVGRNDDVVAAVDAGMTHKQAAEAFGISAGRVRQIVDKHRRKARCEAG